MITQDQFEVAANIVGCATPAIKAVYDVEASSRGYLKDGRVKILFEGHRFWKSLTKVNINCIAFLKKNPGYTNILYPVWSSKFYKGGPLEWNRLDLAKQVCNLLQVDEDLAQQSASYGSFQIMGENHKAAGYDTAAIMLDAYNTRGEPEQLNSFVRFLKATGLDDELKDHNWPAFAKGYNGTGYARNKYDVKLAAAFNKYKLLS